MKYLTFSFLLLTVGFSVFFQQKPDNDVFDDFIKGFKHVTPPVFLHQLNDTTATQDRIILYPAMKHIPNGQRAKFSRVPNDRFYYEGLIHENEDMYVVAFSSMSFFFERNAMPDTYFIATYAKENDKKESLGNKLTHIIDVLEIPYNDRDKKYALIDENLNISVAYNPKDCSLDAESNEYGIQKYRILRNGKIISLTNTKIEKALESMPF